LSRLGGVSERTLLAGASCRNPERSFAKDLLEALRRRERSGSPQPKSRAKSRNPHGQSRILLMKSSWVRSLWIPCVILAVLIGAFMTAAARSNRPMLYQHGNPEAPQGRAFAIMNPFRNRRPEEVAQELMSHLRTNRCEQILRDLHSDDSRICPIMRENKRAQLIWREDGSISRVLVYHLPESESNLWIMSRRDPEIGFILHRQRRVINQISTKGKGYQHFC
jgi:hypothetical protein